MSQKRVYFYGGNGRETSPKFAAVAVDHVITFRKGKPMHNNLLNKKNVGKRFLLNGTDVVTFLGIGKNVFPFEKRFYNEMMKSPLKRTRIVTFEKGGKNGFTMAAHENSIAAFPVGKYIDDLIIENKENVGVGATINVYRLGTYDVSSPTIQMKKNAIRKLGTLKFCADNVWVVAGRKRTKNLKAALKYAQKKYPNG